MRPDTTECLHCFYGMGRELEVLADTFKPELLHRHPERADPQAEHHLEFLSSLHDHSSGQRAPERVNHPVPDGDRSFKGMNFFDADDQALLRAVQRPEFHIHGLSRSALAGHRPTMSPSKLSRQLRRLRVAGLLRRAANTCRYDLTRIGRLAIAAPERISRFALVPAMANA